MVVDAAVDEPADELILHIEEDSPRRCYLGTGLRCYCFLVQLRSRDPEEVLIGLLASRLVVTLESTARGEDSAAFRADVAVRRTAVSHQGKLLAKRSLCMSHVSPGREIRTARRFIRNGFIPEKIRTLRGPTVAC